MQSSTIATAGLSGIKRKKATIPEALKPISNPTFLPPKGDEYLGYRGHSQLSNKVFIVGFQE